MFDVISKESGKRYKVYAVERAIDPSFERVTTFFLIYHETDGKLRKTPTWAWYPCDRFVLADSVDGERYEKKIID